MSFNGGVEAETSEDFSPRQRIQESFSPVTSPVNSPKVLRRRFKSPNRGTVPARAAQPPTCRHRGSNTRRSHKEEYQEVQSEPELENLSSAGSRRLLDKRKGKTRPKILNISDPIPINAMKFSSDGTGLSLYRSANDISSLSSSKYLRTDSQVFSKSVQYKQNGESIYSDRPEKSHLKEINQNSFIYVKSVPNVSVDDSLYENHLRIQGGQGIRNKNVCELIGNQNDSRLQKFADDRQNNLYGRLGFAPLQGSKSLGRLDGIKEVQRLAQYEQYIEALLVEGRENEELYKSKAESKEIVKKGQEESDLERIQDLFPGDALRLYDKDALTMRMKGLMRKRSTTASKLQRALSAKRPDPEERSLPKEGQDKRVFLLETPVQFTTGVQSQERHLFLFNDLLLVAKARSGGNFKLKEKVRISEIWMTKCSMEDVIEVHKSQETSFVIGWPTTNIVATFSTQATRDLWWNKLSEVVAIEREKEPKSTNIQVMYSDTSTGIEYVKTISIGPHDTATRCIALALDHLEMRGLNASEFQLWAKTSREEAPYPLIGHERPFAIKLSCLREGLSAEEGFDLDHCNNVHGSDTLTRCQFILRNARRNPDCPNSGAKKDRKKNRKSPMRIRHVFRRSVNKDDCVDHYPGVLFGQPLSKVTDAGDLPPPPVMSMFQQVFQKGPFTQGIFRKSANARLVRELRDKLDGGEDIQLEVVPVLVTAALLKEFMRSLPEPLLDSALYPLWLDALNYSNQSERLLRLKSLVEQLPKANQNLLAHFLCVLHHIARKSSLNLMSAGNLGVCVGPSLLWTPCMTPAGSKAVPALVEALVTHCEVIIGPHVPHLLGEPPERPQDSGAEESDSLHSGGLRRDDSSIDSLERELLDPPRKDKMSLSRDSGLTMSDSQLYTPDEEESTSSSSCGSGRGVYSSTTTPTRAGNFQPHNKVSSSYSVPGGNSNLGPSALTSAPNREYVRVYGGWEERVQDCCRNRSNSVYAQTVRSNGVINSNFQRQDWFRQRSQLKRLNSNGIPADSGTRSASQESLLGSHSKDEREINGRQDLRCMDRGQQSMPTPLPRSKSSHHLFTPHSMKESPRNILRRTIFIDSTVNELHDAMGSSHVDNDRSYDSSTLSDDDSTPHVSRSNSRGKDCTVAVDQMYTLCDERLVHAAPAQVTVDPPPLPPKRAPLRHLPPVHVDPLPDEKKPTERRGRLRQRELAHKTAAQRSKSLPPPEEHAKDKKRSNVNGDGWTRSGVYEESGYISKVPDVSRTIKENRSAHKNVEQNGVHSRDDAKKVETTLPNLHKSRTIEIPPPYRPPPTVGGLNSRAPITSYHLREALSRRIIIDKGDHQEESYV